MLDLTQFGTVAGLAVVAAVIVQLAKNMVSDRYKPYLPVPAVLIAVGLALLDGVATGQTSSQALASLALTGIAGGLAAVGGYQSLVDPFKPRPPIV